MNPPELVMPVELANRRELAETRHVFNEVLVKWSLYMYFVSQFATLIFLAIKLSSHSVKAIGGGGLTIFLGQNQF